MDDEQVVEGTENADISEASVHKVKEKHSKKKKQQDSFVEELSTMSQAGLIKKCEELFIKKIALEKELEEAKKITEEKEIESLDYLDRYRRSLAEVENVRRRTQNEKQENLKYASFNIISDLLTILDDFERAIEHGKKETEDPTAFIQGIEMIENQFVDLLFKKYGVVKYGADGEKFDPNFHQAVMMEEGDYKEETIVEVFRKGFILHDRVIRPAQVKIGKPKD